MMMKRLSVLAAMLALTIGCSKSSTAPSSSTPTNPTFTADLRPSNEVPAVTNADQSGSGQVTVTFILTRDAANNITAATANFVVNMSGFPAGTTLTGAHIHPGAAGTAGGVVISTGIAQGEVVLANGSGSFSKSVTGVDAALAQSILNNPAGYYFNIHTTINTGGAARGQLTRVQ
jgi:CHRD domain